MLHGPFSLKSGPTMAPRCDCGWLCSSFTMLSVTKPNIPRDMASRSPSKPFCRQEVAFSTDVPPLQHPTHLQTTELPGFCNHGNILMLDCESARHTGKVDIQRSFSLPNNLIEIARSLNNNPMIKVSLFVGDLGRDDQETWSNKYWSQFAGSGVWLPRLQLYFVVFRVVYTRPGTYWPAVSFLRGQVFDPNWHHMDNYTISWAGRERTFPTIFSIPAVWWEGGSFFGPEDPRAILDDAEDAEPVIVFNMILDAPGNPRAMWLHRPFAGTTTVLTIRGEERKPTEKNWAPFFHNGDDSNSDVDNDKVPTMGLHFVYSLHPLRVLKCRIEDGVRDWVFRQLCLPRSLYLTMIRTGRCVEERTLSESPYGTSLAYGCMQRFLEPI